MSVIGMIQVTMIALLFLSISPLRAAPEFRFVPLKPFRVTYGNPQLLYGNDVISNSVSSVISYSAGRSEFEIDSKLITKKMTVWCKALPEDGFQDGLRQEDISFDRLKRFRALSDVQATLGTPAQMYGPTDSPGLVVWEYHFCNGKMGKDFEAVKVSIGLYPQTKQVIAVVIRIGASSD
jgi:hypothetical protein